MTIVPPILDRAFKGDDMASPGCRVVRKVKVGEVAFRIVSMFGGYAGLIDALCRRSEAAARIS
jgi:hypothetical protein